MANNEVRIIVGTQICFRSGTSFNPTASKDLRLSGGTPTNVNFDPNGLLNGNAHNSDKVDLGAQRYLYSVSASLEFAATPTVGNSVDFYWAASPNATAANSNPAGVDGTDGAYTGDGVGTVAESVKQLDYIGSLVCTDLVTTTPQLAHVGWLLPRHRYGTLVIVNNSGAALHNDDDEHHVVFEPVIDEIE